MGFEIVFFFAGIAMIVFMLMRHTRGRITQSGGRKRYLNKVGLKKPEKDEEFGGDVKWSIGDDG